MTLTSGTSWTIPSTVTSITVQCWGGGGGGDIDNLATISGSGGGGGGYCTNTIIVTPGQVINYTVGTAGAAGTNAPTAGGAGGNTTFSTVVANGGGGGNVNNGSGGTGGGGSGGTVTTGANGQAGNTVANTSGSGGLAGNMGSGNGAGLATDGANPGTTNTGGGGGGAQDLGGSNNAGSLGGSGKIVITYILVPGYCTDFTTTTEWSAVGGATPWAFNTTSASSGYTGASGGNNAACGTSGTSTLIFNSLSTVGYTDITVIWGARMTATGASPTFQWSTDGSTWTPVTYTDVANNSTWALINGGTPFSLPSGAEGASNLYFKWTSNCTATYYRMDDFCVQGDVSGTPTIIVSPISLTGFIYTLGNGPSTSQSYTLSGTYLTG